MGRFSFHMPISCSFRGVFWVPSIFLSPMAEVHD
jgi:hypothetical protein